MTKESNVHPPQFDPLLEISLQELITAWKQGFEISEEESKQRVDTILRNLLETLHVGGEPSFLPLDNQYCVMVRKVSEKTLGLTKVQPR
ncbi:MAG: hypothetical protein G01um101448_917 [Parcubacteria group bacterium Gr01-1014_48]|nr:MAG: hypothetical protein Greene041614_783 [Parcubacteria group bacterium Greene0416_14]TSC72799.1 MAG: hypothetical protein G01um101448_917 [Parcubacteria group bacterium Gr01-1014_48]TSD00913.1 MAG: hypothetical protein Greene101415_627 [Parcubacteria group bacterium Greene1014_15]TSD07995.1 MAG: hypothetical protein Greene07144_536 [Parcubacteria group bacterium Greene0714_4]